MSSEATAPAVIRDLLREATAEKNMDEDVDDLSQESDQETSSEQHSDHDSQSELELQSDQDGADECRGSDQFFVGRDGVTWWKKAPPPPDRLHEQGLQACLPQRSPEARNANTPLEAFALFFDDAVFRILVDNTNLYMERVRPSYSRERDANPVDLLEMKAFIGLLLLSGALKASHLHYQDLFSKDGFGPDVFYLTMCYNRFMFLLRCLRFDDCNDYAERKKSDKLAAIRELLDAVVPKFSQLYHPGSGVTVDEQLVGFRGRCSFRQYIKSKPNEYGIKVFALADSRTFYIVNLEVYAGKQCDGPYKLSNKPHDVVKRLIVPIDGSGRNVTMDNWFSSIPLCEDLLINHKLTVVGALRQNKREIPPQFLPNNHRRLCESLFGFKDKMTLVSYVPRRCRAVVLLSTMHHGEAISLASGEQRKPQVVMDYNIHKGGVDVNDSLCQSYDVGRRTTRWPLALFFHLLNVVGINAFIVFDHLKTKRMARCDFLKELGLSLIRCQQLRRCVDTHIPRATRKRIRERFDIPDVSQKPQEKRRARCYLCPTLRKIWQQCKVCNRNVCGQHSFIVCNECKE